MRRREFIGALAAGSTVWPTFGLAQKPTKLPTIGLLTTGSPVISGAWVAAFVQRMHELGWIEEDTVAFEHRWAEGRRENYVRMAADLVALKVDVIVTSGPGAAASMKATSSIPIVFPVASDPLGDGLVASLARPGGNVTGLSLQSPELSGKRLELLRETVPGLGRLGIMANPAYGPAAKEAAEVRALAEKLGIEVVAAAIFRAEDIAGSINELKSRADALYVAADPLFVSNHARINAATLAARLPTMHGIREFVPTGGLLSYGASFPALFRRAGDVVDKILRGAHPSEIPVEQPTKFELVVNLRTAKALGIAIPQSILVRADEVIE